MDIDETILSGSEKLIFGLRELYASRGFVPYRMSKFEEYDLYLKHREFLVSDRVITFTDTGGRLRALRPDVTLSIIKNTQDRPEELSRLCYDEYVYRVSARSGEFREIPQAGVECIGPVDDDCLREVLSLAVRSLLLSGRASVLAVSDLDLVAGILGGITDRREEQDRLAALLSAKNEPAIRAELGKRAESGPGWLLRAVTGLHGRPAEVLGRLKEAAESAGSPAGILAEAARLEKLFAALPEETAEHLELDLSVVGSRDYYSGLYFQGFVSGAPERVLSGGQYDPLLKAMGRKSKGVGFAVYPEVLEPLWEEDEQWNG
jgi:ATP phosphoribosyltransferase regulatory subunit